MMHLRAPHSLLFRFSATVLLLLCAVGQGLLLACSDDDDAALPPYRRDFCELVTSASGTAERIVLDNGTSFCVANRVSGLVPDTVYRTIALHIVKDEQTTQLGAVEQVVSPLPRMFDDGKLKTDAVNVVSIWRTERYVNLHVTIKTGGKAHYFGFANCGTRANKAGTRTLQLLLYHDSNADNAYYSRDVYLSCPLYVFENSLCSGADSVEFVVKEQGGTIVNTTIF